MKTHFLKKIIPAIIISASLASCQDVIDIELKDADRKFVIEGAVNEGSDTVSVRVSKTANYFDTQAPEAIGDAVITLTMPDQSLVNLTHSGNGVYLATGLAITPASTYKLRVDVDGKTFTASTYMPPHIPLDSLEYEFQDAFAGQDAGYNVFADYQDPIGKNWYKMDAVQNGKKLNKAEDLQVFDDNLNDGNPIRIPFFNLLFDPGDTVDVVLINIDQPTFDFYNTFIPIATGSAGSPFSAAPANPVSNIEGGALGLFGSYARSQRRIILPQ